MKGWPLATHIASLTQSRTGTEKCCAVLDATKQLKFGLGQEFLQLLLPSSNPSYSVSRSSTPKSSSSHPDLQPSSTTPLPPASRIHLGGFPHCLRLHPSLLNIMDFTIGPNRQRLLFPVIIYIYIAMCTLQCILIQKKWSLSWLNFSFLS